MKTAARPLALPRVRAARSRPALWVWIAVGGLAVGSADMLFAMAWWAQSGVPPVRILQAIWSWIVGREAAFAGGALAAIVGALVYFVLMSTIVAIYHTAARDYRVLRERPLVYGALYGAAWFVLLHVIVVPLFSAAPPKRIVPDWELACLLAHMLLIGIPAAWMSRRWYGAMR